MWVVCYVGREILCKCIFWLIIKVILRNARCNNKDNYKFQENFSKPGIIDARARYRAAARRLRNTGVECLLI